MPFKTRKVPFHKKPSTESKPIQKKDEVRKSSASKQLKKSFWFSWKGGVAIVLVLGIIIGSSWGYQYVLGNKEEVLQKTVKIVAEVLGEELQKNDEHRTNILLLGSGGPDHDGGYLTDSLIVATLNWEKNSVSMMSIPRDLHVKYAVEGSVRKGKINRVFMEAMEYWKHRLTDRKEQIDSAENSIRVEMEQIFGEEIHYTIYIDFRGLVQLVDVLGGVEVDVEKRIYDTQYPGPNYSYQTFILPAGEQVLSGETTLKYVRSRYGNAGGDFGRSHRQKKVLIALKEKAMDLGVLSSPSQIQAVLDVIDDNFWTSLNWKELLTLADFAQGLDSKNVLTGGVQDLSNPNKEWFLYAPPRDLFGGQSVFLPCRINTKNPWSDIQHYHSLLSGGKNLYNDDSSVSVFNTTKTPGLASEIEVIFSRYGIDLSKVDNAPSREFSVIEYINTEHNVQEVTLLEEWLGIPSVGMSREALYDSYTKRFDEEREENGEEGSVLQEEGVAGEEDISEIMIYVGEDYVSKFRKDILWYKKCL